MISIIIPTHNRAKFLVNLLNNILELKAAVNFEIIVIDNNSCDNTKEVVKSFGNKNIKYVFEKNTSFTKARYSGFENALGDILLYIDDDVIMQEGTLEEIENIFNKYPGCAVAGGKILPKFEQDPENCVLDLQKTFNGWSLYNLGDQERFVDAVPGPMMAIRKSVFKEIGGFPPDTIGVETNNKIKTFKKLYIGPGDYGLCMLCKKAGYKVIYSPKMSIYHIIPKIRLTKDFWISRMVGEGHCAALTKVNMQEYRNYFDRLINDFNVIKNVIKFWGKIKYKKIKNKNNYILPEDLWFIYYRSLLKLELVLLKNPGLDKYLWQLGYEGVSDENFEVVLSKLPKDFKKLAL